MSSQKSSEPQKRRQLVNALHYRHGLSERRACQAASLRRSVYRYKPAPRPDHEIVAGLPGLAHRKPGLGFHKLFEMLRQQGHKGITNASIAFIANEIKQKKTSAACRPGTRSPYRSAK